MVLKTTAGISSGDVRRGRFSLLPSLYHKHALSAYLVDHYHRKGYGVEVRVRLEAVQPKELTPVHPPRQVLEHVVDGLAGGDVGLVHVDDDVDSRVGLVDGV